MIDSNRCFRDQTHSPSLYHSLSLSPSPSFGESLKQSLTNFISFFEFDLNSRFACFLPISTCGRCFVPGIRDALSLSLSLSHPLLAVLCVLGIRADVRTSNSNI